VSTGCYDRWRRRSWFQVEIATVDLSNPSSPRVGGSVSLAEDDELVGWLVSAGELFVSTLKPVDVADDPRPYVSYFAHRISFADPQRPQVAPPVNLPGDLLAIQGRTAYTRDAVWGEQFIETAIARVHLSGAGPRLRSYQRFPNRSVGPAHVMRRSGVVTLSHEPVWQPWWWWSSWWPSRSLTSMRDRDCRGPRRGKKGSPHQDHGDCRHAQPGTFEILATDPLPRKTSLHQVAGRTALLYRPDAGVLTVDLKNPRVPELTGFIRTFGRPVDILVDRHRLLLPARRYGVYEWSLHNDEL
jgi:hypothetical protein